MRLLLDTHVLLWAVAGSPLPIPRGAQVARSRRRGPRLGRLDLQKHYGMSYLFISHDLAVVRAVSHQVIVMKDGDVVESGEAESLFAAPHEPCTRELLATVHLA